jgi:hypothetical protein
MQTVPPNGPRGGGGGKRLSIPGLLITHVLHLLALDIQLGIIHELLQSILEEGLCAVGAMGGDQHVFQAPEGRRLRQGLRLEDVQRCPPDLLLGESCRIARMPFLPLGRKGNTPYI